MERRVPNAVVLFGGHAKRDADVPDAVGPNAGTASHELVHVGFDLPVI